MIRFGIIGAGWRSEFYVRIANCMPDLFCVTGMYIRNKEKQTYFLKKYNVNVFDSLECLLETTPSFIVSCVNKDSICAEIEFLCNKGIAVLSETPIGTNTEQLSAFEKRIEKDWKIQVAEQFHLMPRNQAYKRIIDSGILGEITQVQLSCCHDYHAASLIRFFLDIENELPETLTCTLPDTLTRYNSRQGKIIPTQVTSPQQLAICKYKTKTALYDFNYEQYFSDIRDSRILIRGTKGEIINNECRYLDHDTVIKFDLIRNMCGSCENLDGLYLESITGNGQILYQNPFGRARLSDEDIAIATVLIKMDKYVQTGEEFYSLASAMIDVKTANRFEL